MSTECSRNYRHRLLDCILFSFIDPVEWKAAAEPLNPILGQMHGSHGVETTVSSDLDSLTEMHLSEDHVDVPVGLVRLLFVSGDELLAIVEAGPRSTSVAVDTRGDGAGFERRWNRADRLETDQSAHSLFVVKAGDRPGSSAKRAVDVSTTELR